MSESKTPQAGEWWETRDGSRAYVGCIRPECEAYDKFDSERLSGWYFFRGSIQTGSWTEAGEWRTGEPCALDLVMHLPGCTGWDWKEPQKPPAKPVVASGGWPYGVSLDTYNLVVAERNALQDRLREIEAKAKFYESPF